MYLKISLDKLEGGKYPGFKGLRFGSSLIFKAATAWNTQSQGPKEQATPTLIILPKVLTKGLCLPLLNTTQTSYWLFKAA